MKTWKLIRLAMTAALVLSAPLYAAGKPGMISGWVHSTAGVPQMGAAVEIVASSGSLKAIQVFTDDRGFYSIRDLLPGVYSVKVSAPSFLPSLRENVNLRAGANRVVNLTLSTLFDAVQALPRKPNASDDDDWNWTLRSCANRPILRVVNGRPIMVFNEGQDSRSLKARVAFVAGASDDFNAAAGDMSTAFLVESSLFSTGTLSFDGNVGYGLGTPAVVRAAYTHKTDNGSRPQVALTMRRFGTPDNVLHDGALQSLALTTSDDFALGNALELKVGSEIQTIQFMGRVTAARPFGSVGLHLSPNTVVEYRYSTSEPNTRLEKGFDSAPADLSESSPRMSVVGDNPVLERAHHHEIAVSHRMGGTRVQAAAYYDSIFNTMLTGVGDATAELGSVLPDLYSETFAYAGNTLRTSGLRLVVQRNLPLGLTGTVDYAYGGVLDVAPNTSWNALSSSLHTVRRHALTGKMSGTTPKFHTRWIASYRWINGGAVTPVDLFDASPGQAGAYWNFFIRQPLPGTMFMSSHMEALLEVSNLLAQGYVPVIAQDGRTLYLVQAPRTLRGGVAFSF